MDPLTPPDSPDPAFFSPPTTPEVPLEPIFEPAPISVPARPTSSGLTPPALRLVQVSAVIAAFALGTTLGIWLGSVPRPGSGPIFSPVPSMAASSLPLMSPGLFGAAPSAPAVSNLPGVSAPSAPAAISVALPVETLPSSGLALGNPAAPVTIEMWADFQCPYCGQFVAIAEPALKVGPLASGLVRLVHRDMAFLGPESVDAAVMARYAATKGLFWEMHDLLYASQSGENQGAFSRDRLVAMAVRIGLPQAGARAALDDPALISLVQADTNEGQRLGITSTPTLVFTGGRRIVGVPDAATLSGAITEALGLASPAASVAP